MGGDALTWIRLVSFAVQQTSHTPRFSVQSARAEHKCLLGHNIGGQTHPIVASNNTDCISGLLPYHCGGDHPGLTWPASNALTASLVLGHLNADRWPLPVPSSKVLDPGTPRNARSSWMVLDQAFSWSRWRFRQIGNGVWQLIFG